MWQEQKSRFVWPNGAVLDFRYLERDADADKYQGRDYTRVYVQELTQFPDHKPADNLKATLRLDPGLDVLEIGERFLLGVGTLRPGRGRRWLWRRGGSALRFSRSAGGGPESRTDPIRLRRRRDE